MELRQYLDVLKRRKWLILQCVVVVALVAGAVSALRTPVYSTSSRVLLRPDDPAEQLNPGANGTGFARSGDPDRYVTAQMDVVTNPDVANAAAKSLKGITPAEVTAAVSVEQVGKSDMMDVTGTSADPERARNIADAVAAAYIENRRQYSVAGLQRASADITKQLAVLQDQIAGYDQRIKGAGTDAQDSSTLQGVSGSGVEPPSAPVVDAPTGTGLTDGAIPTSDEALKAARYAAATQYETLFSRQQELQVDMNLKRGEAEIVSPASMPTTPASPKPIRDALLGAFLGLLLGLGLAFLRERADDRLHSREEIEQAAELPVLAELPVDALAIDEPRRLAAFVHPLGRLAESVRSLRTSLAFLGVDGPLERVLVTSAEPGDGKSLVAANLAAVYAQAGYRTILVDSDLRNPRLESIFGGYPSAVAGGAPSGLSGLIAALATVSGANAPNDYGNTNGNGQANGNGRAIETPEPTNEPLPCNALVANSLVRCRHANLAFLPAGPPPPNPAELLGSRSMTYLLEHLSRLADIVILDGPPLLAVTDPAVLAAKVDGVVLVASVDQTHRGALRRARTMLVAGTGRALGVVVNRAQSSKGAYDYDSYYRTSDSPASEPPRRLERLGFLRRRNAAQPVADLGADLDLGGLEPDLHAAPGSWATDGKPEPVRGGSVSGEDR